MSGSADLYMALAGLKIECDELIKLKERLDSEELLEELSDLEHDRWSHWMRYLFSQCEMNSDGTALIPAWAVDRWTRQMETRYSDLSEKEKESDRVEARKTIGVLQCPSNSRNS